MYRYTATVFFTAVCIVCAALLGLTGYRLVRNSGAGRDVRHMATELEPAMKTRPGPETPPPTANELRLLREEIDPFGIRRLETLSGGARKRLLREILERESQEPRPS